MIVKVSGHIPLGERLFKVSYDLDMPNPVRVARRYAARNLPKKVKDALRRHIYDNNREALNSIKGDLLELYKDPEMKGILRPPGDVVYRYIDTTDESLFDILLGSIPPKDKYKRKGKGTLEPKDESGFSSWTTNPRSVIYSGFFNRVDPKSSLMLFQAKVDDNTFLGNPEKLYESLGIEVGHALEREVIGFGSIKYDACVYGLLRKQQSVEGLANDLAEMLLPLKEVDFNDDYYFPNT